MIVNYTSLLNVGAIVKPNEDSPWIAKANKDGVALTSLGQFLTHIPFDLRVARMVALGAVVGKYPIDNTIILTPSFNYFIDSVEILATRTYHGLCLVTARGIYDA